MLQDFTTFNDEQKFICILCSELNGEPFILNITGRYIYYVLCKNFFYAFTVWIHCMYTSVCIFMLSLEGH